MFVGGGGARVTEVFAGSDVEVAFFAVTVTVTTVFAGKAGIVI
jgi:hypothetical protein